MNKYSPKLDDLRARVLDTETLLHFLRDRENLQTLMNHGCPLDTVGAMIDGAYNAISEAGGLSEQLLEARDEDFLSEYKEVAIEAINHEKKFRLEDVQDVSLTARPAHASVEASGGSTPAAQVAGPAKEIPEPIIPTSAVAHMDTIDEIHEQSLAMLNMLMLNHRHASHGEESLSDTALESYAWQLMSNMQRAIEASTALVESLRVSTAPNNNANL